ncbi:hypothetical protein ABZ545_04635 [Streptomyces abikoensis]|uniref:ImmA/IrrE family metallo-endopeptidase n=1 Tax=Streptomyces luteoverticillatus TaxID=66425 RepID=A0A3S9PQ74_STRLT|nr:hypothetical protein [Streptomyces luteoverticillatus]AZQ74484.1 hypothetical protein EKH77_27660 [Streptomyces luteoverticillatus]
MTVTAEDGLFTNWRRTEDEDGASMRVGRIRRRCKQLIQELALPASTDLQGMCDAVARHVRRPIHLVPMSLDGVVSGMTATTDDAYWVVYEQKTSPWHQVHIVLHEIGHLLLGHDQDPAVTEDALKVWTPSVDVATAMRRMGLTMGLARHHCYDNLTERETEILGTLLMAKVVPPPPGQDVLLEGQAAELAASLGPALQHVRQKIQDGSADGRGAGV